MNFKFKLATKHLFFVKLEKRKLLKKWLLGDDTNLVFTFSHSPKLKNYFKMTDADRISYCTFGWRIILSIYTVRNKNAKFYPGLLICMTIKKHLNVDCIPFQSVKNLERGVYAIALPLPHLVCYSFQVNPYSWLQSVLSSDAFARSTYSVALYLLLAGENWI